MKVKPVACPSGKSDISESCTSVLHLQKYHFHSWKTWSFLCVVRGILWFHHSRSIMSITIEHAPQGASMVETKNWQHSSIQHARHRSSFGLKIDRERKSVHWISTMNDFGGTWSLMTWICVVTPALYKFCQVTKFAARRESRKQCLSSSSTMSFWVQNHSM